MLLSYFVLLGTNRVLDPTLFLNHIDTAGRCDTCYEANVTVPPRSRALPSFLPTPPPSPSWPGLQGVISLRTKFLQFSSSATDIVLVTQPSTAVEIAIAQCTSRWAMARGHRLNTSIVLAAVHGLSGRFWAVSAVEPSLSPPLSPSLISSLASVDVKQHGQALTRTVSVDCV